MKIGVNDCMKVELSMRIFVLVLPGDLTVMLFFYVGRVDKCSVIDKHTNTHTLLP